MMRNHLTTATVTACPDLLKKASRVMAALIPALLQILMELADMAATTGHGFPLGKLTGAQPAANRFALDADLKADGPLCVAQTMQFNDSLVALVSALAALLLSLLLQGCSSFAWQWDFDGLLFRRVGKAKFPAPFLQRSLDGG